MQSTVGNDDKTVTTRLLENRRSTIMIPLSAKAHNTTQNPAVDKRRQKNISTWCG